MSNDQFEADEKDLGHMELDTHLRDLSTTMMEVDSNPKVTCGGEEVCLALTMRGRWR